MSRARLYAVLLAAVVLGVPLASAAADQLAAPTIDTHPANPTNATSASFTFSDTDPTAISFQCQIDGGGFSLCISPGTYSGLGGGSHTFDVKALDVLLNPSDVVSYTWLIDTVTPTITLSTKPPNPSNDATPTFAFGANESTLNGFQCKLDAGAFAACVSPTTFGATADGLHTFTVRATDAADNLGQTSYAWTIDTVAPALSLTAKPLNPSGISTAHFEFGATDQTSVTYQCQLDGGAFSACTSPAAYSELAAVAHTFAVRATDSAGNTSAAASYGWTVKDTTAPGDVSGLKRSIGYGILKLAWSRPPDADFDYVRVLVAKGSKGAKGQPRTLVYKGTGTRYTNKRFQNGTYYRYAIISYDLAGNASNGIPVVVPPSVLLSSPKDGVVVHAPPRLVWAEVAKATFYNVQLYFGGKKILSAWPSVARIDLKRSWFYSGRFFRLKKGTYRWYVWPGFGPRSKSRYGQLLGQSAFTVR